MEFTEIWKMKSKDDESNALLALYTDDIGEHEAIIMPVSSDKVIVFWDNGDEPEIWYTEDADIWLDIKDYAYIRTDNPEEEFGTVEWGKI